MKNSQNEKIIKVVLSQTEDLLNYVKEQIDNWLELNVKNSGARWFHIHKGIDLLYINAEGYNTPPLTRLELDIENIDSISAKKVSEFVYLYLKNQFGIEEQSEYLTYDTHNLYFKEENKQKKEENKLDLEIEEENEIEEERIVNYGNQIFNIFQSLKENGNCKVYPKNSYNNKEQIIYNLTIDEKGRLNVTSELRGYDFNPWTKYNLDIDKLDDSNYVREISSSVSVNLANIFLSCYQGEGIRVSSHKTNKNKDNTIALNELYSYLNQMYSVFDYENVENWLYTNGLLSQWIKGSMNGKTNILLNNVKPYNYDPQFDGLLSYEKMLGNLISSSQRFLLKRGKAYQDWYRIQNGENNIVRDKESSIKK
ncbi:MAG: hypothetical protein E7174_01520 [Firmicutes bacterium]|nr:hypothetical protein [Bacillota bacterium]